MDHARQASGAAAAPLAAGTPAPDFTLHTTPDQTAWIAVAAAVALAVAALAQRRVGAAPPRTHA